MDKTRQWVAFVRGLPTDIQQDAEFLEFVRDGRSQEVLDYLDGKRREALQEVRDFIASHRRIARLERKEAEYWKAVLEDDWDDLDDEPREKLSDQDQAEVEWFQEELLILRNGLRLFERSLERAKEIIES